MDGERPTPLSFLRRQEPRGVGQWRGNPDTNPFPQRHPGAAVDPLRRGGHRQGAGIAPRLSGGNRNPGRRAAWAPFQSSGWETGHPSVFPAEAGIQRWGGGANPDTSPFPRRRQPRYPPSMHTRTDNNNARPQRRCARTTPGCFPIYTPDSRYRLFPTRAKNSKRSESNQRRDWEWGAPPSFRRKPESRAWGRGGAHPDTNPFPQRHRPRYPSLMHSRTDNKSARPQGDAPSQLQVVFLSTPPTPDTGCFLPAQKTRNETNPTSERVGSGGAPASSFP